MRRPAYVGLLCAAALACSEDTLSRIDSSDLDGALLEPMDTGGPDTDAAVFRDAQISVDADGVDGSSADAGVTGCGRFAGGACPDGQYCDYGLNGCGAAGELGTCRPLPVRCPLVVDLVCGCDGQSYDNVCYAAQAGVDLARAGGCSVPGFFSCGWRLCAARGTYCQQSVSDVIDVPDDFQCLIAPAGCGQVADCTCLAAEQCGENCVNQGGGPRLVCPGN